MYKGDEADSDRIEYGCVTVSSANLDSYQVIGMVAECHLIESPVIMELTVQHSTFAGATSLDLKFTSVDTRCALYRITSVL